MKNIRSLAAFFDRIDPVAAIFPGPFLLIGVKLCLGQVFFWGTFSLQFVPWWVEAWRQVSMGILPAWNGLNGMGAPLLANYQTAFFYPPNWLIWVLAASLGASGIAWGLSFLTMAHMIFAGTGVVLLLRQLGLGKLAQIIGGLAFSMSGYIVGRIEFVSMTYVAAWLPWVFMFADQLSTPKTGQPDNRRVIFSMPLAVSIGLMLLAGHAQLSWYTLLFSAAWVVVKALRGGWRAVMVQAVSFGVAGLAGALLAAVQLLPTAEYLLQSQRSAAVGYTDAVINSFWPWRILTLFAPDLFGNPGRGDFWGYATYWEDATYIGMLPVLLSLGTFFVLFKRNFSDAPVFPKRLAVFLWVFIAIGFAIALGQNGVVFPFLYRYVPTFALFQAPARYLIWVEFALVILAGIGIERWRCPQNRGLYWLRLATAGAFAVTLGAGLAWIGLGSVKASFIRSVALAGLWALGTGVLTLLIPYFEHRNLKSLWNGLVYVWVLADILAAVWFLNPMIFADFYAGARPRPTEVAGFMKNQLVYIPKEDLQTLKFERFLSFTDFRPTEDWRNMRDVMLPNLNLLEGVSYANNFDPMVPARYSSWLNAVESSSTALRDLWLRSAGVARVEVVDKREPGGVRFDPIQSRARFSYFSCAVGVDKPEDVHARFNAAAAGEKLLVLEGQKLPYMVCPPQQAGTVTVFREWPGKVILLVKVPANGWVSAAITNYPGWEVSVDNQPAQILAANYLFMAVTVTPQTHVVILQYVPKAFFLGLLLSILILILLVVWVIKQRTYKTNKIRKLNGDF